MKSVRTQITNYIWDQTRNPIWNSIDEQHKDLSNQIRRQIWNSIQVPIRNELEKYIDEIS